MKTLTKIAFILMLALPLVSCSSSSDDDIQIPKPPVEQPGEEENT